jgi:hypothetical protein
MRPMKSAWVVGVLLVGCGGGGGKGMEDAPRAIDAAVDSPAIQIDARPIDAPMPDAPTDAPVVLIDAPIDSPVSGVCNVLMQTGCNAGEKCTQIKDQDNPAISHIGCAPTGVVAVGAACTTGAAGPQGYDDCVGGSFCVSGQCKSICDNQGGAPTCGANYACKRYQGVFESGGVQIAGVCDVKCDPLTQVAAAGTPTAACGSTTPASPNKGCYGLESYSCATVLAGALTLTDRTVPPNYVLNACAPGFMPILYSATGSTTVTCNGLCAALETDNTAGHVNNGKGDPTALGKLPTQAAPAAGNATCNVGVKGSEASSSCVYMWLYLADDFGTVPPEFTPWVDLVGVCIARDHYRYDLNNDGQLTTADPTYPDCATLPPRSTATPGFYDDAADFGCQKLANSMFAVPPPSFGSVLNQTDAVPLRRHDFR